MFDGRCRSSTFQAELIFNVFPFSPHFIHIFVSGISGAEKMAQNIREEITRLQRRKQLNFSYNNALERMQDSESSGSEMGPDSPHRPDTPPNAVRNPEKGLFTFKQVKRAKTNYPFFHLVLCTRRAPAWLWLWFNACLCLRDYYTGGSAI